ncbi:MAG: protein arginine kinase [Clostridia bacterium]|nr:protein arginine kinase [Clostridia bacterium]
MAWYNTKGKENDVIVSSRVRFARNIADYPFETKLDETSCREIIEKVEKALGDEYDSVNLNDMSAVETMALVEKHYISPNFAKKKMPHSLLTKENGDVSVMVCEEDHIRIQSIKAGLALDEAYQKAVECDNILGEKLNIAFDKKYGYLTHCLTNLGLGMRVSVMVFLPALTMTRSIENLSIQLSKLGLVVRGMYGEGSSPDGCLYQISNRVTMGVSEQDTIEKLKDIAFKVAEQERQARKVLLSDNYSAVADRVCRAYGVLKYARIMSSKEFLKLYSDVRLGIALGLINDIEYETLGNIMIGVLPANLIMNNGGKNISEYERDILRADYIRSTVG